MTEGKGQLLEQASVQGVRPTRKEGGGRKRREHQDLRHEGVAASAVLCEVGLMSGAAPVSELKGRQTDTSLGWTTGDLDEDPRCLD